MNAPFSPDVRLRWLPLVIAVLLAGSLSAAEPASKLQVATEAHDFGTVTRGDTLRHDFKVTNLGDAALEILDVQPACGCTTAGEWTRTIAPGGSGTVPVRLETAQFSGPISKTVTLYTSDPARPEVILTLRAVIWTPVSLSSPSLVIPPISAPEKPARGSITIRNETNQPLSVRDVTSDNPLLKPELKEVNPGKLFELTVETVPPLPEETQTGRITFTTSDPKTPELSVPVFATVLPAVQIAPVELSFSTLKLAHPERRMIAVLCNREFAFEVSDLSTDAPGVTLNATAGADRKQTMIGVTFPAGFELRRDQAYVIRGKTNHPAQPAFQVTIVYIGE